MIKRYILIAITSIALSSDLSFANETEDAGKPVVQDPIPPVNVDMKSGEPEASVEEKPAIQETAQVPTEDKMGKPLTPKRIELDTNYDGKVDRIEMYDSEGRLQRVDIDTKGNGNFDQWFIYENGKPKMMGKDKNSDGKTDTWVEY
jgi:hypothetical protein